MRTCCLTTAVFVAELRLLNSRKASSNPRKIWFHENCNLLAAENFHEIQDHSLEIHIQTQNFSSKTDVDTQKFDDARVDFILL